MLSTCACTEYVAMYTYESSEQGDLSFQQGDIVVVTRKEGDWWTGMVGGKTGVFPSNYVKPRDSASEVTFCSEHMRMDQICWCICNNCCLNFVSVFSLWDQQGRRAAWERNQVIFQLLYNIAPLQLLLCTLNPFCRRYSFDSVKT